MTRRLLLSCALAVLAGAWAAPARADQILWSYSVTPDSAAVKSTSGLSAVRVIGEPLGSASGNSDVVLASLSTISKSAAADSMGTASYSFGLKLTDEASGMSGVLTFGGNFGGTVSSSSAHVTNAFTGLTTQSITLGANQYTVTLGTYLPPGAPGATLQGGIGASVSVQSSDSVGQPASAPEPTSLVLAGLGCSALLFRRLRRRFRPSVA